MTKKTRLIILLACVVCFLTITPMLIAYSMGYRFDFEKNKIVSTGGIYVRTFPAADQITIDSNISQKPGFLANSVFVQSLLPKNHTVSIKKSGYYDYNKTLPVEESQVTKLENVLLIKTFIAFNLIAEKNDYFSTAINNQHIIRAIVGTKDITFNYVSLNTNVSVQTFSIAQIGKVSDIKWSNDSSRALIEIQNNNNKYYYLFDTTVKKATATRLSYLDKSTQQISFNPQNSQEIFFVKNKILYSAKNNKTTFVIKNLITYKFSGNNITWLSTDGLLSNSDTTGKLIDKLITENIKISTTQSYQIFNLSGKIFFQSGNSLFLLNQDTKKLKDITPPLTNYKILDALDENKNLNLIYWNSDKIYLYSLANQKFIKLFSGTQINNCQWINSSYIIFTESNKTIISEIDYRNNINNVTLPDIVTIKSDPNIPVKIENPNMYFNQQDGKIYLLTNNTLLSSDKITP